MQLHMCEACARTLIRCHYTRTRARVAPNDLQRPEIPDESVPLLQGEAVGRVRYQLLEKMLQPCGPPPEKEDEG